MAYGTPGLIHLIGRQSKHMWLIIRQLSIKAGWWGATLTIWNLAKAICLYEKKNRFFMSGLIHKVGFSLTNFFLSKLFITVNLLLWTDVSLLNVLGCFPSFHNSSKKLCIVLWPSRWEKFNLFCYFWFDPVMTLSLIIKLSPIVWQGTYTLYSYTYTCLHIPEFVLLCHWNAI